MKWLVGFFLLANLLLMALSYQMESPRIQPLSEGHGKLPRVSDLRVRRMPIADVAPRRRLQSDTSDQGRFCGRISGFRSRDNAEQFVAKNDMLFKNVSIEAGDFVGGAYFWVIVPPFAKREPALAALESLQRAGVDSYLVTEGEYRLAISLGLFESRRYAQDLNARFQKQNIETVLVKMPLDQLSYALAFEAAARVDRTAITARLKRYGPSLEVIKYQPCQGVATSTESP